MSAEVESKLRGPEAMGLAYRALELMERHQVWPTPLNYELWVNYVTDPTGALATEMNRMIAAGEHFTDTVSESLASAYLSSAKLNDRIRDAGDLLSRELQLVSRAVQQAQRSQVAFGKTLVGASEHLTPDTQREALTALIEQLALATHKVHKETSALEKRLNESTNEVERLKKHLEQVKRDATTDGLTNLANRKAFDEELERACAEAKTSKTSVTLALIDIDHFKSFNDTWGHQTGDQVLRYVASVIGRAGAPPRLAARYGGEEFAMIFPGETQDTVAAALEEVRAEVSSRVLKRRSTNEDLGTITISAGFAELGRGENAHAMMERADAALYASKRGGRNRITNAEIESEAA
jgi:diguanylate cyclase